MSETHNGKQILIDIIEAFSLDKFTRFFREKNHRFTPRTEDLPQYDDDNFGNGAKLGELQFAQDEKMLICAFEAKQSLTERSGKKAQYEKGKKILKDSQSDAGIFIFYDPQGKFRFSLIYANYLGRKRDWSAFRRWTYFVSKEYTNKTFLQQIGEGDFSSLQKIKEAFSVEKVTKEFYTEIANWYFWAVQNAQFPKDFEYSAEAQKDDELRNAVNLIRLITRIVFIWFIRQKGIIPDILFDKNPLKNIVRDFCKDNKSANYYNAILQNLFFGTLNQKMDERGFVKEGSFHENKNEYGVKNLFRCADKFTINEKEVIKLFKDIPFLNGGLFDCLDKPDDDGKIIYVDGFSRNPTKQAQIPDYLFFQENETSVDLSSLGLGRNQKVKGLFEILNNYNFTIDENTPIDQEVALDPELLGKVFENLLASYNPETATTARKATGSYYTPREIVDYMVDESLIAYLENTLNDPARLRQLLSYSDEAPAFSNEDAQKLIAAIDNIKILDPACGSGAFPMGILHKLVYALQNLDPENKHWRELQHKKALKESEDVFKQDDKDQRQERLREINEAFDEGINYPDYARKLYLIENCIYGVDIQPIAVQISKLRFFISLVLDQKVDKNKANHGILSLPNLETKFVSANTLIALEMPQDIFFYTDKIRDLEDEIKSLRHKYFQAKTRREKLDYQKKDKKLRELLAAELKSIGFSSDSSEQIAAFDLYDQNTSADWFDPEWMFGVMNGFDIVIGNPPYVRADSPEILEQRKKIMSFKKYQTLWEKWDLYVAFIERAFQLLCNKGVLEFIISDAYMTSKYAIKSHKYFLEFTTINRINFCSGVKIFDAAVKNIIIEFKKEKNVDNIPRRIKHKETFDNFEILKSGRQKDLGLDIFKVDSQTQKKFDFEDCLLWGEICYVSYGLRPSSDERFWKGDFTKDDLISDIKDKIHPKSYIEGKWINRYVLEKIKYLEWGTERSPKKLVRPTFPELYIPEKILMGGMTGAIYDNAGLLCNHSITVSVLWKDLRSVQNRSIEGSIKKDFKIKKTYSFRNQLEENSKLFNLKYLLAILNSHFAYKFLDSIRRSQIGFYPDDLKKLPIKKISHIEQKPFIALVDQILAAKKKDPQSDSSALEREIDKLVYELYGLTEEEIKIVEGMNYGKHN